MKRYLLLLSALFSYAVSFAQSETEPNDDFASANSIYQGDDFYANVGPSDIDYFTFYPNTGGALRFYIGVGNYSGATAYVEMNVYDGRQGGGGLLYSETFEVQDGVYDIFERRLCALEPDDYYVSFTSTEDIDYYIRWEPFSSYPSDVNNETSGTAISFNMDSLKAAYIGYQFRGGALDTEDWFKSTPIPAGDNSSLKLYMEATHTTCYITNANISYEVYKYPDLTTPIAQGVMGGNSNVPSYGVVNQEVLLNTFVQGDIFYVKLTSTGPFGYHLRYSRDPSFVDPEDNCCINNAIVLNEDSLVSGNVGKYNYTYATYTDEVDMYRIILPHAGAIKLFSFGEFASHVYNTNPELHVTLVNKLGTLIYYSSGTLVDWEGSPVLGAQARDTIKIRALEADTFYLRVTAYESSQPVQINYRFKYQLVDSACPPDVEPNDIQASAIPISEGQLVKGHLRFTKSDATTNMDHTDFYKANLPHDGKLRLFMKVKYRGNFDISNLGVNEAIKVTYVNGNKTDYMPSTYLAAVYPDSTFIDTLEICPSSAGLAYISLTANLPYAYEYEFSYELFDTLSWANDSIYNNDFNEADSINPGEVRTGRLMYYQDRYISNGNPQNDGSDYYKASIPVNGMPRIIVEATNTACQNAGALNLSLYKTNNVSSLFASRNIGDLNSFPPGITIYDTIDVCNLTEDSIFLRFNSNYAFKYKFHYLVNPFELSDTTRDIEPNNNFNEAIPIGSDQSRTQYLGLNYNNVTDVNDYFKMVVPGPDTLKINWRVTNISCVDNRLWRIWGYNKNHNLVFVTGYVLNGNGTIDAGQTKVGGRNQYISGLDTIYLRFEANGLINYEFSTEPVKPSGWFTVTGDSSACEGSIFTYRLANFLDSNVTFNWSLPLGGGNLTFTDSVATVEWTQNGNRRIEVVVSNSVGSSPPVGLNVIVNGQFPTQTPVAYNFARTLSTNTLPPGSHCQWYKNDTLIAGATDSVYYAADAGSFTVKFVNDCGPGPSSNAIVFPGAAQVQTITFPHVDTITMSPTAKAILQATSSSALPVFYQKISGPGNILNDTLFVTGVGSIIVKAMQPGDDVYSAATPKYDTIIVKKGNQVITFGPIANMLNDAPDFNLAGTISSGQVITYDIITGDSAAQLSYQGNGITQLSIVGVGNVTVRASQSGNANYNPAASVDQSFCVGIRNLGPITGDANPCLSTYQYRTEKVQGANYVWTLSGGGILTTNKDTAWVQWQTPGSYTLTVKANSPCDAVYSNTQTFNITTSNNQPGLVSGMLPVDHAIDQQLPLLLSWVPGANTVSYDLYVWDSAQTQPATPYISNLTDFSYQLPLNAPLPYNTTYKWRVVAKNPCSQTAGPIQHFRLIPLPDLMVSDVTAPASVVSGQTINISWKVTNVGPGSTLPESIWYDGVYLALDTLPNVNFHGSPNWNPYSWSSLTANGRPLIIGMKQRPTSLSPGQFYTNSASFTLPQSYNFPVYVYVITDNQHPNWKILQVSVANDTARKATPVDITMAPVPDLRVDSVFTNASTFSGSTVNVTYKVKNYGVLTPAGEQWVDSFFISQNPLFNRADAIPLKQPKFNNSYYPNAMDASLVYGTQLAQDSFVYKTASLVIPNKIFGTWFIYVKTNAKETEPNLFEGSFGDNNVNKVQVEVYLTPTPKLTVNSLNVPVTNASTTQTIGTSWVIKNEGFYDNIERNKGHYITNSMCVTACENPCNGCVCYAPSVIKDSVTYGSSYWLDRVYLSTDSGGLNINNARLVKETTHGILNSGLNADPPAVPGNYVSCPALVTGNVNVNNIIHPNDNFAKSEGFTIPADLQPGNYYVYVYTNPTKTVFEYPGTPQIKRSSLPVSIQRPDAIVASISAPPTSFGGQTISINYSVQNNGPGAVYNHLRKDRLYISNFSNFDGSAQLVNTASFTEDLPVGTAVPHSMTFSIPPAYSGTKYFFVLTNFDSSFKETNNSNNLSTSTATSITAATASDLVVTAVNPGDSIFTIYPQLVAYTVTNNGTGTTQGSWKDSLFVSCSPVYSRANSYFIGSKTQTRNIAASGSYSDSITVNMKYGYEINSCFPEQMYAPAYFYVVTNADSGTYEGSNLNNNVGSSGSKVLVNPLVDHIVHSVSGPDTTTVGSKFISGWTIKNIGYKPSYYYYNSWLDGLYFSSDSIASINDQKAASYLRYVTLDRNQEVSFNVDPYVPNMLTGDYYVYIHNNYSNGIFAEKVLSNNVDFIRNNLGAAKKIHVIQPPLSDLVDSILSAPATVAQGQPITIAYRVTNKGNFTTFPGNNIQNQLRLDNDFVYEPNDGARLLATRNRLTPLAPGEFYDDTVTVIIPSFTPVGNYIIMGRTNSNGAIIESNNTNNLGFSPIEVFAPPVTDLIITSVTKPDTVMLGYTMDSVKWVVKNNSGEQARGSTKDGIYLSAGSVFDSSAVLLGMKNKYITMNSQDTDSLSMAPLITGVVEGNYNVFVKTDIQNNIIESEEENNIGMSVTPVYVKVKELPMNVDEVNTLDSANAVNRYYKLRIPDSLYNATIMVTLKTNDSTSVLNEMYIASGRIPTPANHDYMFEIPNYGNQQIVMSDVRDSVYYIMYRCVSPAVPTQTNVKLKAVVLPFAILNVHTNSGGNIGNVTIRIRGSRFTDSMVAKLSNGVTTIYASAVYYSNNTQVYATFPLQGRPLGVYDVTLIKPDLTEAVLPNGFSIVPANNGGLITGGGPNTGAGNGNAPGCDPGAASGWNSQLSVELIGPTHVLSGGRPIVLQVNFSNPTNFDIPAQSRIIYSEWDIKMALTKAGVPNGTTSLYLELVEPDGPPGIIRAGGSGSILIYSKTPPIPPPPGFTLFKLK